MLIHGLTVVRCTSFLASYINQHRVTSYFGWYCRVRIRSLLKDFLPQMTQATFESTTHELKITHSTNWVILTPPGQIYNAIKFIYTTFANFYNSWYQTFLFKLAGHVIGNLHITWMGGTHFYQRNGNVYVLWIKSHITRRISIYVTIVQWGTLTHVITEIIMHFIQDAQWSHVISAA